MKTGLYRHFKGGMYEVYCTTQQDDLFHLILMILYRSVETGELWVRQHAQFIGLVNVGNKLVERFTLVEEREYKTIEVVGNDKVLKRWS